MQRKYRGLIDKLIVDLPVNTGRTSRQNHSYYPWNMEEIKNTKKFLFLAAIVFGCVVLLVYGNQKSRRTNLSQRERTKMADKIMRTDKEWKKLLTPLQYKITRKKGTERSSTGKYHNFKAEGIYQCLCCGNEIFNSETKFDSGTGWPSFWDVISPEKIEKIPDNSLLSLRTEVACSRCDAHLGHVFNDGPKPTGLRYCINSAALKFVSKAEKYKKATFAAGCFWGVEAEFRKIEGVKSTTVGYSGGDFENPTYSDVCAGKTGHAEAVEIVYDPEKVSYEELLEIFWNIHDPTLLNRQGPDIGTQYRSVILFDDAEQESAAKKSAKTYQAKSDKPVVTEIVPVSRFYRAEEYHQQYLEKQVGKSCNF